MACYLFEMAGSSNNSDHRGNAIRVVQKCLLKMLFRSMTAHVVTEDVSFASTSYQGLVWI